MKGMEPPQQAAGGALPRTGPDRHVPFIAHLGIRRERAEAGEAVISLELQPHMLNNHGAGHGGVLMALLDAAMAHAALSRVDYAREVVTVDMHVGFMKPATGRLVATGRATGGGRSVCFCEARIEDADGRLAAQAMGTFRYRELTRGA
ncbi:PaaI family thioesterase [Variovorax paradoxus]|nr:PaaI family thioesterase [Variovorax paradoxus]